MFLLSTDSNRVDKIRGGWFCLFIGLGEFDTIIITSECTSARVQCARACCSNNIQRIYNNTQRTQQTSANQGLCHRLPTSYISSVSE